MTAPRSYNAKIGQTSSAVTQDMQSVASRAAIVMEQNRRIDDMLRQLTATQARTVGAAQKNEELRPQKDLDKKYDGILS